MENGDWRMENGEWRMENGEWRMENGRRGEECLALQATHHRVRTAAHHPLRSPHFMFKSGVRFACLTPTRHVWSHSMFPKCAPVLFASHSTQAAWTSVCYIFTYIHTVIFTPKLGLAWNNHSFCAAK
jgi:hypothetical protein